MKIIHRKCFKRIMCLLLMSMLCVGCGQNHTETVSETETQAIQDDIIILYTSDVHCGIDENGVFVSVEGERRVKDIMVMNDAGEYEPIDADKTYTMASHNYLIKEGGSATDMFVDNVLLIDEGMIDYEILINYITENLGGELSALYRETEGRIVIE